MDNVDVFTHVGIFSLYFVIIVTETFSALPVYIATILTNCVYSSLEGVGYDGDDGAVHCRSRSASVAGYMTGVYT